ncbi:M23/M56 family metallopeptidase [Feifania hominis]|uniref:Peptidoglycan DD-metalloendopeptidase family protein n=1 Tax=Feifania hominis TaxID=2763660 RepID=A0A926DCG6_9FIRM|nr:M23/M56 family metallopeptidase [Feifania hominis]MBC8535558.1 peptidoglycan DD-metalloendopeptidase family protein [Feifania hominis]
MMLLSFVQTTVLGGVMIAVILLLRAALKGRLGAGLFRVLWALAALRLLIPAAIRVSLPVYPILSSPVTGSAHGSDTLTRELLAKLPENLQSVLPAVHGTTAAIPAGMLFWLFGCAAATLYFAVTYCRCRAELRTSLPADCAAVNCWISRHAVTRKIEVRVSDKIATPLTYGIFHPVILLPKQTDWTDERQLDFVLTHEWVHIRRYDALYKLILTAALCLHWCNPLVWVMALVANRDLELSCDEQVLRAAGEQQRQAYALTLLTLQERRNRRTTLYSHFGKYPIEERITAIMKYKKTSLLAVVLAVLLAAAMTTAFALMPQQSEEPADGSVPIAPIEPVSSGDSPPLTGGKTLLCWPAEDCYLVTASFGLSRPDGSEMDHITISGENARHAPVLAAADGIVSFADFDGTNGNCIVIDHINGLRTVYSHCAKIDVKKGDTVKAGDAIATIGSSGSATGPCLGFAVYEDDIACDPVSLMPDSVIEKLSCLK